MRAYEDQTLRASDLKRTLERKYEDKLRKLKDVSLG